MELTFGPRNTIEIDDARIIFRNFRGIGDDYNAEGSRHFTVVIPDMETAEKLQNDVNRYGVGWNVKIKAPREEGMDPLLSLKVKVKFNDEDGPNPDIYLESNGKKMKLTEENVGMLDRIDIASVDLRITPYDSERRGEAYRTAYLDSMYVVQNVDRFAARFAGEDYDDEY